MTVVAAALRPAPRSLIGRRLDPWLTGWLAVVTWIALAVLGRTDVELPTGLLLWVTSLVSGAHFIYSYRLAYRPNSITLARRRGLLVGAPLALTVLVVGGLVFDPVINSFSIVSAGVRVVYTLTLWHFIKQVFGVVSVAARQSGFWFSRGETRVLRYGLYPIWIVAAVRQITSVFYLPDGLTARSDLVVASYSWASIFLSLAGFVVAGVVIVRVAWRLRRLPPGSIVAPLVAMMLWVGFPYDIMLSALFLPLFHALQYLPFCFAAEAGLDVTIKRGDRRAGLNWVRIIVTFGLLGVLALRWTPELLASATRLADPYEWGIVVFVVLNLHHYLIDATIWRRDGDLVPLLTT